MLARVEADCRFDEFVRDFDCDQVAVQRQVACAQVDDGLEAGERALTAGGDFADIRDVPAKAAEPVARLAALFMC
jgi:hypothetical protein